VTSRAGTVPSDHADPVPPVRTCVGCRARANKSDLLRVVAPGSGSGGSPVELVPDVRSRLPGRGAYLHLDPGCLDLAERRRSLPRALRLTGPADTRHVRDHVEAVAASHPPEATAPGPSPR
jgi:predicted RNA-binding protein YlxR (DUF448 family)